MRNIYFILKYWYKQVTCDHMWGNGWFHIWGSQASLYMDVKCSKCHKLINIDYTNNFSELFI